MRSLNAINEMQLQDLQHVIARSIGKEGGDTNDSHRSRKALGRDGEGLLFARDDETQACVV